MMSNVVFLCGGQGSQFYGMGRALYTDEPVFRREMQRLDEMARAMLGRSVIEALYASDRRFSDPFDDTLLSHPAIFMVEVAMARALEGRGVVPDCILGVSLGEFASLVIAGSVSSEEGLRACVEQAKILSTRCKIGGMLAILAEARSYRERSWVGDEVELAALNLERHFVVSGPAESCDQLERRCRAEDVSCARLPVRIAFHTSALDTARDEYLRAVADISVAPARIPILFARKGIAEPWTSRCFWDAAREPIYLGLALADAIQFLPCDFVDLSPGGTLATLVKHAYTSHRGPAYRLFSLMAPFGAAASTFESLEALQRSC